MSSSLFYGLPRTRRQHFLGNDNLLRHIDCNQSDISDDSSDDEVEVPTVDRNSDEESSSTESEDEVTAPTTGLKVTYEEALYVEENIILAAKSVQPGRPSNEKSPIVVKKVLTAVPRDVRKDGTQHWPLWNERRTRCKTCKGGYTFVSCSKCQVYLCLNKDRNCFTHFHQV
ncbi:hypothetical protein MRX96_001731 [Rhipicephalus microplus]